MESAPTLDSAPQTCGKSIASMVLGILSFLCFGPLTGIPAIILGHVAQSKIRASSGALVGSGQALAGLIMGYVNLAVSLMIVPIYLAILVPAVQNAIFQGQLTSVMNNGRNIHVAVFKQGLAYPLDPEQEVWPKSGPTHPEAGTFASSTDYFAWMVTSEVINVDFSFFGAPGLPAAVGTDPAQFTAANNAWCIVANVDADYPGWAPVLFTRNIRGDNLADLKGQMLDPMSKEPPFGSRGGVVVLKDGSTFTVKYDATWEGTMRNQPLELTNPILRP